MRTFVFISLSLYRKFTLVLQGASKVLSPGDTTGPRKHGKDIHVPLDFCIRALDFLHLKAHEAASSSMTRRRLYLSITVCHSYPWNAPLTYIQAAQIKAGSFGLWNITNMD